MTVRLYYSTRETEADCADESALRRAFGAAGEAVSLILTLLIAVTDLAELTRFACVAVRLVTDAAGDVARFVIRHGFAEISVHAHHVIDANGDAIEQATDPGFLRRVRAIVIDRITVSAPIPA